MAKLKLSCQAHGCYDRYTCELYKMSSEPEEKPFNIIPDTHIPGDEECEFYKPKKTTND